MFEARIITKLSSINSLIWPTSVINSSFIKRFSCVYNSVLKIESNQLSCWPGYTMTRHLLRFGYFSGSTRFYWVYTILWVQCPVRFSKHWFRVSIFLPWSFPLIKIKNLHSKIIASSLETIYWSLLLPPKKLLSLCSCFVVGGLVMLCSWSGWQWHGIYICSAASLNFPGTTI